MQTMQIAGRGAGLDAIYVGGSAEDKRRLVSVAASLGVSLSAAARMALRTWLSMQPAAHQSAEENAR